MKTGSKIISMSLQLSQDGRGAGHDIRGTTEHDFQSFYNECLTSWFRDDRFSDTTSLTLDTEIDVSTLFPYAIQYVNKNKLHVAFDPIQKIDELKRQLQTKSSELASLQLVYQSLVLQSQQGTMLQQAPPRAKAPHTKKKKRRSQLAAKQPESIRRSNSATKHACLQKTTVAPNEYYSWDPEYSYTPAFVSYALNANKQ